MGEEGGEIEGGGSCYNLPTRTDYQIIAVTLGVT